MIRDYSAYLSQRWNELRVVERAANFAEESEEIEQIQTGALILIAGELRHTTRFEGRRHEDVGLLFKNWGNFYHDSQSGLDVATDILCVRDTDASGKIVDANVFAIVDCITNVKSHNASPGWIVQGLVTGADVERFREVPEPAHVDPPVDPGTPSNPNPPNPPSTDQIAGLLLVVIDEIKQTRAAVEKSNATLEGIRRDVQNGAKILQALIAGGGLGNIVDIIGGLIPKKGAEHADLSGTSKRTIVQTDKIQSLPEGFDRER